MGHPMSLALTARRVASETPKVHEGDRLTLRLAAVNVVKPDECDPVVVLPEGLCIRRPLARRAELHNHRRTWTASRARRKSVGSTDLVIPNDIVRVVRRRTVDPHADKLPEAVGAVGLHLHHGLRFQFHRAVCCSICDLYPEDNRGY